MKKLPLAIAATSFLLAVAIVVFAEGARAVYSGIFFVILGAAVLWTARRKAGAKAP